MYQFSSSDHSSEHLCSWKRSVCLIVPMCTHNPEIWTKYSSFIATLYSHYTNVSTDPLGIVCGFFTLWEPLLYSSMLNAVFKGPVFYFSFWTGSWIQCVMPTPLLAVWDTPWKWVVPTRIHCTPVVTVVSFQSSVPTFAKPNGQHTLNYFPFRSRKTRTIILRMVTKCPKILNCVVTQIVTPFTIVT